MWSFGNGFARDVVIFGVDDTSCHADNQKYIFLVLDERPTEGIDYSVVAAEKK